MSHADAALPIYGDDAHIRVRFRRQERQHSIHGLLRISALREQFRSRLHRAPVSLGVKSKWCQRRIIFNPIFISPLFLVSFSLLNRRVPQPSPEKSASTV